MLSYRSLPFVNIQLHKQAKHTDSLVEMKLYVETLCGCIGMITTLDQMNNRAGSTAGSMSLVSLMTQI